MSRKRSRKVLYEVSNDVKRARESRSRLGTVKRVRAFTTKFKSVKKKQEMPTVSRKEHHGRKLSLFRLFMNFSVKKALILLAIFVLAVILWPFGGANEVSGPEGSPGPEKANPESSGGAGGTSNEVLPPFGNVTIKEPKVVVAGPPKDHYIVIASHKDKTQLEPVAKHFLENGIETEFLDVSGGWHQLITKERFLTTRDLESKAYRAKKKVVEVGDEYKPPKGFGSFTFDSVLIVKEKSGD